MRSRASASPIATAALCAALYVLVLYWSAGQARDRETAARRRRASRLDAHAPAEVRVCELLALPYGPAMALPLAPLRVRVVALVRYEPRLYPHIQN